jgi:hypothetical protein
MPATATFDKVASMQLQQIPDAVLLDEPQTR